MPDIGAVGIAAQKKSLHATEQDGESVRQARADYQAQVEDWSPEHLKFIDESGIHIAMTRHFGRASRGERVHDAVPRNHGKNVSVIGALSFQGIDAVMAIEGATDGAVFHAYVEQVLAPTLVPGDKVIMDNLSAHKVDGIRDLIEAKGAQLHYLPPYSPDLSPIEPCWSKIKTYLRRVKARTREALDDALDAALDTITASDARGWFAHCGYAVH